jgi:hypothetical protein
MKETKNNSGEGRVCERHIAKNTNVKNENYCSVNIYIYKA